MTGEYTFLFFLDAHEGAVVREFDCFGPGYLSKVDAVRYEKGVAFKPAV